jgi:hypothetical protein
VTSPGSSAVRYSWGRLVLMLDTPEAGWSDPVEGRVLLHPNRSRSLSLVQVGFEPPDFWKSDRGTIRSFDASPGRAPVFAHGTRWQGVALTADETLSLPFRLAVPWGSSLGKRGAIVQAAAGESPHAVAQVGLTVIPPHSYRQAARVLAEVAGLRLNRWVLYPDQVLCAVLHPARDVDGPIEELRLFLGRSLQNMAALVVLPRGKPVFLTLRSPGDPPEIAHFQIDLEHPEAMRATFEQHLPAHLGRGRSLPVPSAPPEPTAAETLPRPATAPLADPDELPYPASPPQRTEN